MKARKLFASVLFTASIACLQMNAFAQAVNSDLRDNGFANINSSGSSLRWDVRSSYVSATLVVSAPDGRTFTKEFKSGNTIDFAVFDTEGARLPDGTYSYELRLTTVPAKSAKETLAVRGRDDDPETLRASKRLSIDRSLVQSGSFSILNGVTFVPGAVESNGRQAAIKKVEGQVVSNKRFAVIPETRHHHPAAPMFDFVIADDLIVQGSACVGIDCVNNEDFGFDTIRVKENNTRLQFDDTSVTAGFPTNNWQIRANSSASGGASFLAFVDHGASGNSETGTILFEVDAGAPANSLKVSSSGRIGLRTATPVLDLHMNTSNTPGMRLEQNSSGGFTAQTWDVSGNEANFFVRDVTSGSRLPFRIRPGAPTSAIDIAASGNVGFNNPSPETALDVNGNTVNLGSDIGGVSRTNATIKLSRLSMPPFTTGNLNFAYAAAATTSTDNIAALGGAAGGFSAATVIVFHTAANTNTNNGTERMRITSIGRVGIGTTAPDQLLSVNGDASKVGGGSWQTFSDERLKRIVGPFNSGLNAVMQLQPLRYEYKPNNALGLPSVGERIGFGAQAIQKVIPEAVTKNAEGYLMVNNDPIIWAMLNAIKEQQAQIDQLKGEIKRLRAGSHKRR